MDGLAAVETEGFAEGFPGGSAGPLIGDGQALELAGVGGDLVGLLGELGAAL